MQTIKTSPPHYHGHRKRARAKFVESQYLRYPLKDYEIFELALAYCNKRKDTKPIAKNLLKAFTSVQNIFTANNNEYQQIPDIGASSVAFLNAEHEFIKRSIQRTKDHEKYEVDSRSLLSYALFISKRISKTNKEFWLIALGKNATFINCVKIEGICDAKKPFENYRPFLESAFNANALSVVICSNLIEKKPAVSIEDLEGLEQLSNVFKSVDIHLHEHIIICKDVAIMLVAQSIVGYADAKDIEKPEDTEYYHFNSKELAKAITKDPRQNLSQLSDIYLLAYLLHRAGFKDEEAEQIVNVFAKNFIFSSNLLQRKLCKLEFLISHISKDAEFIDKFKVFIGLQRELTMRYILGDYHINPMSSRKALQKVEDFAHVAYFQLNHCHKEEIWLAHFNKDKKLIVFEIASKQGVETATIDTAHIVQRALLHKTETLIICHNHPNGSTTPSKADIENTKKINQVLKNLGIHFLEHIIVADNSCTFMLEDKIVYY